jgi:hypothetical protein
MYHFAMSCFERSTMVITALLAYDNRNPIPSKIATEIMELLTAGGGDAVLLAGNGNPAGRSYPYNAVACSMCTISQATMSAPDAGLNLATIQLETPWWATSEELVDFVKCKIGDLYIPTSPYFSVVAVEIV